MSWFRSSTRVHYSKDLVKRFTYGPTTLAAPGTIKSSFKDREGCVITPQVEQFYAPTGGQADPQECFGRLSRSQRSH